MEKFDWNGLMGLIFALIMPSVFIIWGFVDLVAHWPFWKKKDQIEKSTDKSD